MTVHVTIWWLWYALIAAYVVGVVAGLKLTTIADDLSWWLRPVMLVWPLAAVVLLAWRAVLFMAGKE